MGEETKPNDFRKDIADAAFVGDRLGHWLCMRGHHKWGRWSDFEVSPGGVFRCQHRTCWRCNKYQSENL